MANVINSLRQCVCYFVHNPIQLWLIYHICVFLHSDVSDKGPENQSGFLLPDIGNVVSLQNKMTPFFCVKYVDLVDFLVIKLNTSMNSSVLTIQFLLNMLI